MRVGLLTFYDLDENAGIREKHRCESDLLFQDRQGRYLCCHRAESSRGFSKLILSERWINQGTAGRSAEEILSAFRFVIGNGSGHTGFSIFNFL